MDIDKLMLNAGPSIYYDEAFMNVLEAHLTFLKNHSTTVTIMVEPMQAIVYEFDFTGLANYYRIPAHLHWLTMRMNNMTSLFDSSREITSLLVPNPTTVDQIRMSHMTTRKLTT